MAAAGIGDDFQHRVVFVRADYRTGGQVDVALFADGVGGAVALDRVGGAEEQGVGGLIAFQVQQAQGLTGLDDADVVIAGADGGARGGVFGEQGAVLDHGVLAYLPRWYRALFWKPRWFSGRKLRQKSSSLTGAAWLSSMRTGV